MEHQGNSESSKMVFVDADAFVALARQDDTNHEKAVQLLDVLDGKQVQFVTSNYVFAESVTVISQRVSHEGAVQFINVVKSATGEYITRWISEELERLAIRIFKEQASKNVSFVDCTNMALMRTEQIQYIFSFDGVYKKSVAGLWG